MTGDPALRFWVHYAERQGALTEHDGERTVMVLPPSMQQRFSLSETIAATSDPELAREEGALLLIPGHPLLDQAAGQVLEEGDGGHIWLGWPSRPLPSAAQLLAAARERVGVDHGRIDPGGVPVPRYAPVLRVGVQVTYSLHDRFHELEEAWIDAVTGLPLPGGVGPFLLTQPRLQGKPPHPGLEADVGSAIASADRHLDERAGLRLEVLARGTARLREEEEAMAESYYTTALESIEQRRPTTLAARQHLLDAQAEATRAEWARRRQEIEEKFTAHRLLRPIRLHLIWVPAMTVPVVIHRGGRGFPLSLTWWLLKGDYAPLRCPGCGASAPLVAARDRLRCRACFVPAPVAASPVPARAKGVKGSAGGVPKGTPVGSPPVVRQPPEPSVHRGSGDAPDPQEKDYEGILRAIEMAYQETKDDIARRQRVARIGDNLGFTFWQAVVLRDSWPRKRASPDSPLRVLYRLYGAEGPLRGIALSPGEMPLRSSSFTHDPVPGMLHCTDGVIVTGTAEYPFSLHWRMVAGKPAVEEVLPVLGASDARIPARGWIVQGVGKLYAAAPPPRCELDPVAAELWARELPGSGLPVVARCLAAWWRVQAEQPVDGPTAVVAAAVATLVGRRAGVGRTREQVAQEYGVDLREVAATGRALQRALGLSPQRWW